jgi:hypothetical protein
MASGLAKHRAFYDNTDKAQGTGVYYILPLTVLQNCMCLAYLLVFPLLQYSALKYLSSYLTLSFPRWPQVTVYLCRKGLMSPG